MERFYHRVLFFCLIVFSLSGSTLAQNLSTTSLKEDLEFFRKNFPLVHKNAYHTISEEDFNFKIDNLIANLENRNIYEIYVGFMDIIASVGDGHTWIDWWQNPESDHYFPVKFEEFNDGIYLTYTVRDYETVLGKKLVEIEGMEIEKAMEKLLTVTPGDNIYDKRRRVLASFLSRSTIPYGLGLTKSLEEISFTFEDASGMQMKQIVQSQQADSNPFLFTLIPNHPERVSARDLTNPPHFLKNPHERFWIEYLPDHKAVYFRFWTVLNDQGKGLTLDDIASEMKDMIDSENAEKLIIDVRYNGGGNNQLTKNLLHEIIKAEEVNQPGRLFLLINDFTFSAAGHFTTYIEQHTNSILVGSPTAFSPNHYGDNRPVNLPNTGWKISASAYFWQNSLPWDYRTFTEPDLYIEPSFSDYSSNHDPVLEFVLNYNETEGSLITKLKEAVHAKDKTAANELYGQLKTNPLYQFQNVESAINQFGYQLLGSGKLEEAIIAFKINVEQNPESANAHDSLGDGYIAHGQNELAIRHSKKALDLNPSANVKISAETKLNRLRGNN